VRPYKCLVLLLFSLIIANPVILFLLTQNILVSILTPSLIFAILYASRYHVRSKLISVYLANIFAIISIFLHAEVIFSTCFPNYVIDNLYQPEKGYYFNKPYLRKHFVDREYSADYITNCQGYRIPDGMNQDNRISAVDWLVIGDSFTQGAQVSFEQLYTTLLHKSFPNKIVLNAGISGAGIVEEYNYYHERGQQLSPSVVILQLCSFNDFMNVGIAHRSFTDYLAYNSKFIRYLLQDFKYQNSADLPLGRWTEPFQRDPQANSDYNIFYKNESTIKKRDLELFGNYLMEFNEEVKKRGARLIVFLMPTREQVDISSFQEVLDAFQIQPGELDMLRPNKLLKELTDDLGVTLVDMLDAFRATPKKINFSYDEHLTIAGHEVLATELSKVLLSDQIIRSTLLSKEYAGDRYPMYSKDGMMITFQSPREGKMELFLTDREFREIKRLTSNDINESHPMMSHDGSRLAFTEGDAETLQTKVQVASLNDINKRIEVTGSPDTFGAIPCFSPDDRFLAYAEWQRINESQYSNPQIVIFDLYTREKRYVTKDNHESWRPVFTPDGNRLIYIAKYQKQFDLYLYHLDSDREERITWTPFDEWDPQFSRDGRYIVYSANPDGNWDLFVYDLTTGETCRLTESKGDEWDASFALMDEKIIYGGRFGLIEGIYEMSFSREQFKK